MDSMIASRSGAKGRSPSASLNHVWSKGQAVITGGGLYPGYFWGRSKWNRGDSPSRHVPIVKPSRKKPQWLRELLDGNVSAFRKIAALPPLRKRHLDIIRLTLLLLGGDVISRELTLGVDAGSPTDVVMQDF